MLLLIEEHIIQGHLWSCCSQDRWSQHVRWIFWPL